jgi:hypothetical protein
MIKQHLIELSIFFAKNVGGMHRINTFAVPDGMPQVHNPIF